MHPVQSAGETYHAEAAAEGSPVVVTAHALAYDPRYNREERERERERAVPFVVATPGHVRGNRCQRGYQIAPHVPDLFQLRSRSTMHARV
jgi:hypothetical protein